MVSFRVKFKISDEHPCLFHMGFAPGGSSSSKNQNHLGQNKKSKYKASESLQVTVGKLKLLILFFQWFGWMWSLIVIKLSLMGPVHTYMDIFESATFSFRVRKYPRPHVMWSQRIHIEFARPHVFGFTADSLRIDKIVPLGTGSSRSNPESSRTALLSYTFKLFLPAVLSGR